MELLKLLNGNILVVQAIVFLILLVALKKFFWGPMLSALDQRRERIASELKEIEMAKGGVQALKEEYHQHLAMIDIEAMERYKHREAEGERAALRIRQEAQVQARRIVEDAKAEVQTEVSRAKEGLRDEMVGIVVRATEKMIQEKLTFENDGKLIETFLEDMKVDAG